jgi:DNA-binding CsgD family transcriptional regulator
MGRTPAALHEPASLPPRRMHVQQCLSQGLPIKRTSRKLELSEHAIKDYITRIFQAPAARNRTEAVIKASRSRRSCNMSSAQNTPNNSAWAAPPAHAALPREANQWMPPRGATSARAGARGVPTTPAGMPA